MNKYHMLSLSEEEANSETNFNNSRYLNLNILRTDHELFKDEDNVVNSLINVKRVKLPNDGEDWEILEDKQIVLTLRGTRFTKSEKKFLRTVDGVKFLMEGYRSGIKSVVKFKEAMKKLK